MHIQFLKLTLLQKIIKKLIQGYRWDFHFWDYCFLLFGLSKRRFGFVFRIFHIWDLDSRENVVLCSWENAPLKLLHFCFFFFLVSFPFYYFLSLTRRFIYIFFLRKPSFIFKVSLNLFFFLTFTCCIKNGFNTFVKFFSYTFVLPLHCAQNKIFHNIGETRRTLF